jgi:AcrR family transcriptional regulator
MRGDREEAIVAAAYALLERQGFAGTTMQAIAREARASMETLYRWYGDKTGLFRALIARNTGEVAETLREATGAALPLPDLLDRVGTALLAMLLGPRAVALNRAAAADATGTLGQALAQGGRETLLPQIRRMIETALTSGDLQGASAEALTETWLSLLIGDLQIRRATGALPPPPPEALASRAQAARLHLLRLYAPPRAA